MRPLSRPPTGAVLLAAVLLLSSAPSETPAPGAAVPLDVRGGRCEFVLPSGRPGDQFVLVAGSLDRGAGPHRVTVRTEPTSDRAWLPRADDDPGSAWRRRTDAAAGRLERARCGRPADQEYPPLAEPPRQRTFHVFVGEHDFGSPDAYAAVAADLRAVGCRCQVYVDRAHPDPGAVQPAADDVVRTFDDDVYPRARRQLGRCLDVDRDGRFTVLFSPSLAKMSRGKVSLGGFVRGSDFYRDLPAPLGNRCDLLYLNTDLRPGPHLRALVAHEYTHAVVFCEHVLADFPPGPRRQDEEGWLNEGLAHVAEGLNGFGWSNLDYRVSAFLSAPERYRLVVPDYYGERLWRSHGNRGATYLFLRSCCDRHPGLPARLVQSDLAGVANLEAGTREPFADLFRRWCVAVARGEAGPGLYGPLGGRLLCGPHAHEVSLAGGRADVDVAGTAAAYVLLHSPGGGRARVTVDAEPGADLQVTLVPLPPGSARLSLRAEPDGRDSYRLVLAAHGSGVTLEGAAWERAVPKSSRPEDSSYRPGDPPGGEVREWFGARRLQAGEPRTSAPVDLPGGAGAWVFKVWGRDAAGRAVAAWAEVTR
jgi:hypothetical protein